MISQVLMMTLSLQFPSMNHDVTKAQCQPQSTVIAKGYHMLLCLIAFNLIIATEAAEDQYHNTVWVSHLIAILSVQSGCETSQGPCHFSLFSLVSFFLSSLILAIHRVALSPYYIKKRLLSADRLCLSGYSCLLSSSQLR